MIYSIIDILFHEWLVIVNGGIDVEINLYEGLLGLFFL
jgi:hypothetical protein